MKKVLVLVLVAVLALSVCALTACNGKTYEGEYSYVSEGRGTYGCKVKVTIQDGIITAVEVVDTDDMHNVSPGWTNTYAESGVDSAGKTNWLKKSQAFADSFVGLTTKEVLNIKVYVYKVLVSSGYDFHPIGEPITGYPTIETIKYIPDQLAVVVGGVGEIAKGEGATQSSGRLILAVQNAILKSQGKTGDAACAANYLDPGRTFTGEYKYVNSWNHDKFYGCKVDVTVKDGKITGVKAYSDKDTGWTRTTSTWTAKEEDLDADPPVKLQLGFDAAEAAYEAWFAQVFVGKTVEEVLAYSVVGADLETGKTDNMAVNTAGINLKGATQSSIRWILAVQNALSKIPA